MELQVQQKWQTKQGEKFLRTSPRLRARLHTQRWKQQCRDSPGMKGALPVRRRALRLGVWWALSRVMQRYLRRGEWPQGVWGWQAARESFP